KPERITVTGMGPILTATANIKAFQETYKIADPIILFLAQHYPYKGYQQLLQAAPLVWKKIPEAQFVFVGPTVANSEQYFKNQDPRIHRLGALNLQEKTNVLAACTLLCVPSTQESFGGVYTEAWHFAKPIIGCNIPAVSEVIDHGINGYLVNQKPESIADAICQILLNSNQAQLMGQAGKCKLQKQFTWSILAQKTELVYRNLLSSC
ncbi:MAG: glycosyltransferase family 4 protein, partial [Microcystaceae cyanobacterium]